MEYQTLEEILTKSKIMLKWISGILRMKFPANWMKIASRILIR
jgi:hypothetical protein